MGGHGWWIYMEGKEEKVGKWREKRKRRIWGNGDFRHLEDGRCVRTSIYLSYIVSFCSSSPICLNVYINIYICIYIYMYLRSGIWDLGSGVCGVTLGAILYYSINNKVTQHLDLQGYELLKGESAGRRKRNILLYWLYLKTTQVNE
jgi:hypothetical protein